MASGYDLTSKHPFRLQQARLGIYDKKPFQDKSVNGINDMALRLETMGGHSQQERMIHDKREALNRAVHFSYQAAQIRQPDWAPGLAARALINPDKLKQDYDDKVLSVGYEYNLKPGDVFEWIGTGTHWLIYLQDLTELAYFRGDIRKCSYEIKWEDDNGNIQSTWVAIRGPVETRLESIIKNNISIDIPNYSLHILMPKTAETIKQFQRYTKFYLTGADELTSKVCWRIEATDTISTPGILELNAVEYYSNPQEDDIENGTVGTLIIEPEVVDESNNFIYGEGFIKPKKTYEYVYRGRLEAEWFIDTCKYPIEYSVDGNKIKLTWLKTFSGQFEIQYGDIHRTIVVESLF